MTMKRKASKKLAKRSPPILIKMFITPGSMQIFYNIYWNIKVFHTRSLKGSHDVLSFFPIAIHFSFWSLFSASLRMLWVSCPSLLRKSLISYVPEGEEPIIRSQRFERSCQILCLYSLRHAKPSQWKWQCLSLLHRQTCFAFQNSLTFLLRFWLLAPSIKKSTQLNSNSSNFMTFVDYKVPRAGHNDLLMK